MKILVLNAGSSSIKYQLFEMTSQQVLARGLVEKIGETNSRINHSASDNTIKREADIANHTQALEAVTDLLLDSETGVIAHPDEISAVGHRVVHGGERFSQPAIITPEVKETIKALIPLAPLHNPANLNGIEVAETLFANAPQVAVFDTAFHQTLPPASFLYGLPYSLYQEHHIRVYGFHGTSHLYVSKRATAHLKKEAAAVNLITLHLGNGCSVTAVKGGQAVDTSMGFSPLPGLLMGTRSGDIDPAVVFYLGRELGMSLPEIDRLLNKESGLLGLSGSNDLREIQHRQGQGDNLAQQALDVYAYRIKKYIGAYFATLGRVDAIVFTAGVGENSPYVRQHACAGLENLGITLDTAKNEGGVLGPVTEIQADDSRVKVLLIPTNEELEIAQQTMAVITES